MATFGQLVIGPPGCGKTTYCYAVSKVLDGMGRKTAIVNIDPANEKLPFKPDIDVNDLITLDSVMSVCNLGPNGSFLFSMEHLEQNIDWLLDKLKNYKDHYIIFDCPGQIELYTHHCSVKNIVTALQGSGLRLCAVQLTDAYYCRELPTFVSAALTSLLAMLQVELPHVNVLSKVDIAEKYGKLQYALQHYTEFINIAEMFKNDDDNSVSQKYKKLTTSLVSVVEDYGLVSFVPMSAGDKKTMMNVIAVVDRANGYGFGKGEDRNIRSMLSCAVGADTEAQSETADLLEKYAAAVAPSVQDGSENDETSGQGGGTL